MGKIERRLPEKLQSRLTKYTVAAGALLAGGASAKADIVVWDASNDAMLPAMNNALTNTIFFDLRSGAVLQAAASAAIPPSAQFELRLNSNPVCSTAIARFVNDANNQILATAGGAARLSSGAMIGGAGSFRTSARLGSETFTTASGTPVFFSQGNWRHGDSGFLGLRFSTDGGNTFNYGWAQVQVDPTTYAVTLNSFAYDTTADEAIAAGAVPEPREIVLLALGAIGVAAVRARRKAQRAA